MDKMDGKTMDIVAENVGKLKELFPEAFTEGKVDFEALKEVLGTFVDDRDERYSFTWNGKSKARMIAQTPSTGTLRPCKEESVDWGTTQNIFIEGDNLEVLKLLQKSYHKKVKMIYIDPPYNTGKDFVYKDNFKDNIKNYKEITGQVDGEGRNLSNNPETSGRYHTDWLNMMYPRLKLARNLLKDDGVILISIGDEEQHNLRKLCDEIYGEENYYATINWTATTKSMNAGDAKYKLQKSEEYILVYGKVPMPEHSPFNLDSKGIKSYPEKTADGKRYRFEEIQQRKNTGIKRSEKMVFPILEVDPKEGYRWTIGEETARKLEGDNNVVLINGKPTRKIFEDEELNESFYPLWANFSDGCGTSENGKSLLLGLLKKEHGFETVKPVELIEKVIFHFTNPGDLILDFFAGSNTTAHAILNGNIQIEKGRKYIAIQIPEICKQDSDAYRSDFRSISEISLKRIKSAIQNIKEENPGYDGDLGFKVFKLDATNIKPWEVDFNMTERTLEDFISNIKTDRREEDVLYEILLKYGLDLTLPISEHTIAGKKVFNIGMGALIICLADAISLEVVEGIVQLVEELKPEYKDDKKKELVTRVVFKDSGFKDDVVKTNAVQIMKQAKILNVRSL